MAINPNVEATQMMRTMVKETENFLTKFHEGVQSTYADLAALYSKPAVEKYCDPIVKAEVQAILARLTKLLVTSVEVQK